MSAMSSVPPPLPPQQPSFAPAHAPPLPQRVQPISYGTPTAAGARPGLLTAVGILSVVIGVFGIFLNASIGITAFGMMVASRATRAIAAAATPPTTPRVIDDDAMSPRERRAVIDGFSQLHPLSSTRRRQLDAILLEGGRRMIPGAGSMLTPSYVRGNISDSGRLPDADGGEGPDYFILGRGRLELSDTHAVFYPLDGRDPIRAQAPEPVDGEGSVDLEAGGGEYDVEDAGATAPGGLDDRQVQAVVQHIQSMLGAQQLTPAQVKTLSAQFSDPQSGFFTPAPDLNGARVQVTSATRMPSGEIMIGTRLGHIRVDAAGNVINSFTQSTFAATRAGMGFRISEMAVLLSMLGSLAGVGLAIYLIVCGSLVLRQHPKGGRLHAIYAWLKIPLTIGCAIVWVWMFASLAGNAAGAGATPVWQGRVIVMAILVGMIGCAYPVGLLLALRSPSLRNYYNAAVASGADGWSR
jgi:hypothetical protein